MTPNRNDNNNSNSYAVVGHAANCTVHFLDKHIRTTAHRTATSTTSVSWLSTHLHKPTAARCTVSAPLPTNRCHHSQALQPSYVCTHMHTYQIVIYNIYKFIYIHYVHITPCVRCSEMVSCRCCNCSSLLTLT